LCVSAQETGNTIGDFEQAHRQRISVISLKQLSHKASTINRKTWIWIGLGLVAVSALHIYYVQEMLAAFVAFSLLFVAVSTVVLIIFFLVRTIKPVIAWATPKIRRVVHQGVDAVEGVIASSVWAQAVPHRFRREQLKLNEKYKMVYLRLAGLKSNRVYRVGLRAGGAALTIGLYQQKRISKRLGNWLTQRVSYSDLIQVRPSTGRHRRTALR
jgi:ABC-type multidrug transport system fused ATPase/permease subunit